MSRDQRLFLHDIVERCDRIADYTRDMEYASFVSDSKTFDAVARNLEIIGEAVKQLSPQTRASHSGVDWRKIAGLRDIVIHQYFGIDEEIIWDVVKNHIPKLREKVSDMLQTMSSG